MSKNWTLLLFHVLSIALSRRHYSWYENVTVILQKFPYGLFRKIRVVNIRGRYCYNIYAYEIFIY